MMFVFIFFLTVHSVQCYINNSLRRIYTGFDVNIESYPHAAFLHFEVTKPSSCGGSLIMVQVVLTAAHCVDELHYNSGQISAYFGANTPKDSKAVRKVVSYEINPKYNDVKMICNLAVAFLSKPVPLQSNIKKIPLAKQHPGPAQYAFAVGWGKQNIKRPYKLPDFAIRRPLRATKQRIIDEDECEKFTGFEMSPNSLCTVPEVGHYYKDDSGDGMVMKAPIRLVGVMSYVANGASIHTGVASFRAWILKTAEKLYFQYCKPKHKG